MKTSKVQMLEFVPN